jgi:protein SCO1/2
MDRSPGSTRLRRLPWAAALVAWNALLAPAGALAHDADPQAAHPECHHGAKPPALPAKYVRQVGSYSVPDVTLVDQDARPVRLRELLAADEALMVNFIFTTCTAICPVMSRIFAGVPRELGESAGKLRMVSISIDPENDTPPRLKAYAGRFAAGPQWEFLTGSVKDVVAVQRAFDAYRSDKMEHEPLTLLRSAPGKPWVRIEGFASAVELAREYRDVSAE